MKITHAKWVLVGSLALGWFGPAQAALAAEDKTPVADVHADAKLVKATSIINRVIKNQRGNDVGRVMDLIIDGQRGQIAYAVARFGDWDFGETRFAIPWGLIKEHANKKNFTIPFEKDKLSKDRGFSKDAYPDMSDPKWAGDLHQHFGVTPYWQVDETRSDLPRREGRRPRDRDTVQINKDYPWTSRVNDMIGKPVFGPDTAGRQQELGTVKDLIIDMEHGHVTAFVVAKGKDENQVPWASVQPNGKDNRFTVVAASSQPAPSVTTPSTPQPKATTPASLATDKQLQNALLMRSSAIINGVVQDAKGADVGRIMDLIIDSRQGQVAYAVMRFGEWYGQTRFLIPWAALKDQGDKKNLTLNITKDQLNKEDGFDAKSYPELNPGEWNRDLHRKFNVSPYWENRAAAADADTTRRRPRDLGLAPMFNDKEPWSNRANDIIGREVHSHAAEADGKRPLLGRVKDLVIDVRNGQVVYAVVSGADNAEKLAAVPWSAIGPFQNEFHVRASKDTLFVQGFNEGSWPKMTDAQWARTVHERFNQDPYWTVFGFAGYEGWDANWRRGSSYNKLFKEDTLKTIRGKVTKMDTFTPASGAAKGRMLTLKSDDDVIHIIHLGPADYVDRNNRFVIREGDELVVTGSTAKFEDEPIVIANRVRKGDDTLQLRDRAGLPMWDRADEAESNP